METTTGEFERVEVYDGAAQATVAFRGRHIAGSQPDAWLDVWVTPEGAIVVHNNLDLAVLAVFTGGWAEFRDAKHYTIPGELKAEAARELGETYEYTPPEPPVRPSAAEVRAKLRACPGFEVTGSGDEETTDERR
jgi:hypothetical protein